jgi:hypothetical protein
MGMTAFRYCLRFSSLIAVGTWASQAVAGPINTDTALPVADGHLLWREQVRFLKAEDSTRDLEIIAVPSVFVYGFTEKFALIGIVPYVDKSLRTGGLELGDNGLGDSTLLARYQITQSDRPGETVRAQALAGLKFPTGRDDKPGLPQPLQLGSGSFDPIVAGVFSWQQLDWEFDADLLYKINTEANNVRFGNTLAHDVAFSHRLWPWRLPEHGVPALVYGVLELNGVWAERDSASASDPANSGGYTLFLSPGLQYVTRRWVAEISVQLPVAQQLNGNQLKTDYIISAGFRIVF